MTGHADRLRLVVLISGNGSNLQALIDAAAGGAPFAIVGVLSNRPDAYGLQRARAAGLHTEVIDHTTFADRASFDSALAAQIDALAPGLVVLAGFMRILSDPFVEHFAGRMINIHPSLLPAFQGLHTHRRALEGGVREHGASVHFVTPELDGGPVIAQARVEVHDGDTEQTLAERVLQREHVLLPQVVTWLAERRIMLRNDRVWCDGRELQRPLAC